MLTTAEEDRLEAALPLEFDVEYEGPNDEEPQIHSYELTPYWGGTDHVGDDASSGPEYPAIVFEWDSQGEEDAERQPVDDVASIDENEGEETIIENNVARVFDDLSVAIEVRNQFRDTPPLVRASQIARALWKFCRFELEAELDDEGENGERPMLVEVLESPSGFEAGQTLIVEFQLRLRHVVSHDVEIDAVTEIDPEVGIE